MKTKKSRLFLLTALCVLSAFFACAFMFSPASDNKANVVYADSTATTITAGQFFTSAYNTSNGWNIQDVENWKTSGKALSFDYKNNTGDSFTSFYFRGYSGNTIVTGDIIIDLVNNMAMSGNDSVAKVISLGDGWYRVLANYENIPKSNDGTLNQIYFAGISGNSLSLNNITFKATAHSDPLASKLTAGAVYTSANPAARNWNITGVANWKTSGKALYFEYKNVSGAAFYITPQSSSAAIARQITVAANNTVSFWDDAGAQIKYGIVTDLGDGWYSVLINYQDLGVYNGVASNGQATLSQFYFTGVGTNIIYVNNFDTGADEKFNPVTITTGTYFSSGWHIEGVENWKTSGYALSFDYKNNTGDSFTSFYFRGYSGNTIVTGDITVDLVNNMAKSGNDSVATVTSLGDGWYRVLANYENIPKSNDGTLNKIYFAGIGGNSLSLNNITFKATAHSDGLVSKLTAGAVYTSANPAARNWNMTGVANWKTSGKALYFEYKNVSGAAFYITPQSSSASVGRQITVAADNTVSFWNDAGSAMKYGIVKSLGSGWYGVTINYKDLGVAGGNASNGEATLSQFYFTGVGSNVIYVNNFDTEASAIYTVSVTGGTIGGASSAKIVDGESSTVVAGTPAAGKYFHHWAVGGESVSTDAEYTFTVEDDVALTAVYYDFHGTHVTAAWSTPSTATYDLDYDTVTFDYKPVGTNTAKIAIANTNWSKFYGYYTFTSTGTVDKTTGVSITPLDDGYFRVVMTTASLTWTNSAPNRNNVPDFVNRIITNTASDWYIDNVVYYKACTVTVTNGTGGTTVNYGTSVTVTANTPATGKYFAGWSDGSSIVSENSSYTFTATGNVSLTATYGDLYTVSVTGGTINGESSDEIVEGQEATVVAGTPATGKYFHHWEVGGESVSTDAEYTFTVDSDVAITAVYYDFHGTHVTAAWSQVAASNDLLYDTVTFDYKPVGTNTANIALAHATGSKYYGYYTFTSTGTVNRTTGVSITTLDDGYFRVVMTTASLAWTNNANNLNNVPDSIHCIITNTASDWYIDNVVYYKACTVTVTNGTGGTTVNYGTSVTVTANAAPEGKFFSCWKDGSGNYVSGLNPYTFTATGNVSLTATYAEKKTVSVTGGTINGESSDEIVEGQEATVVAGTPATGKYFHHWEVDDESVSTDAEYTFTVEEDVTLTAVYYDFHGTHVNDAGVISQAPYIIYYDTVTFDYKPVGSNTVKICLLQKNWTNYFGYYTFTSTGTVDRTTGVSITTLDDGYFRVVMTTSSLAWTNGANNRNNVPDDTYFILCSPASDWYIDNVSYYKACTVTVTNGSGGTTVNYGSSVTVTANDPATGKAFLCWKNGSDEIVSRDASYTFDIFGDVSLTACYADKVSVSASSGTVNGGSSANVGDGSIVTLVAGAPATGYYFFNWTNTAGDVVATTATANVVVDGATTYTANYLAYEGTKYAANTSHSILPTNGKPFSRVSFEYKIVSGSFAKFALLNNWNNYYGYFKIGPSGLDEEYDGVSAVLLEDGYYSVSIDVEDVTKMAGTLNPATSNITQIFIHSDSNAEIYIRSVTFTEETGVFRMYEGASVRLIDPYGIRFRAFMSYDMYDEDATYGMIILPYDYITSNEIDLEGDVIAQLKEKSVKYRNFTCVPVRMASTDYYIQGSITNILEKNLTREFIGIGYYISDGDYYYVQNATSCRRTIVGVSESAIKNYETFTGYTAERQEFLLETSGSDGAAAGAAFSANAFDSIENFKKNDSVSTSATLTLSAAKGESEFGQIVLTATSTVANKAYIIIPNDLTHSDGSTVLDKANFELFNAYYTDVDSNWIYWNTSTYPYATPISTGYYVNALVPFYAASASSEAVFDRTNGDNQTIFVRFNVPADQKAGVYTGSFRIYVLGVGYKDVSVSFTVNKFTLPEENNYKTKFGISEWDIKAVFGTTHERTSEEYTELYELLLDYNLNGGQIPASMYNSAVAINGYIAKLVECYNDPKVAAIQLYCSDGTAYYEYQKSKFSETQKYTLSSVIHEYDWTDSDGITNYGTRSMLKAIAEYCVENDINLFEKLYFRLNDEPNSPEACIQAILSYNAVKNGIDYALSEVDFKGYEDIENSLRYLPYLVTCSPSAEVEDAYDKTVLALYSGNKFVDSVNSKSAYYPADANNSKQSIEINYTYLTDYVPTFKSVIGSEKDSRVYSLRTDSDPKTHVWWYSMITTVNPYPHYVVNANQVINRSKTWATYYYGIEGELYYSVNDWKHYYYDAQGKGASDQLDEEAIWNGEDVYYGGYEEGTLVYPNVTRYAGDFKYCPTYRLVATSEGIDDYNYICYAQSLIDAMATGSAKTAAQNSLNTCVDSMIDQDATDAIINSSASTLRTARNNLIALIEELVGN